MAITLTAVDRGNNTLALNTPVFGPNSKINSSANLTLKNLGFRFVDNINRLESYSTDSSEIINSEANCLGTSSSLLSYTNGTLLFNTTGLSSFAVDGPIKVDVFNWFFDTSENVIQSTIQTNLTSNEKVFIFVEHTYSSSGIKTVIANGTTSNDLDSEQIAIGVS